MYTHLQRLSPIVVILFFSLGYPLLPLTSTRLFSPLAAQAQTIQSQKSEESEWQEFTSTEGGFTVLMPGIPDEQIEPGNSEKEIGETRQFILGVDEEKVVYFVSYTEFLNIQDSLTPNEINQILDGVRDGSVGNGKLLKERRIELDGNLGREIEFENSDGFFKARIYWAQPRLYILILGVTPKAGSPQESDRFLDSFKLLTSRTLGTSKK